MKRECVLNKYGCSEDVVETRFFVANAPQNDEGRETGIFVSNLIRGGVYFFLRLKRYLTSRRVVKEIMPLIFFFSTRETILCGIFQRSRPAAVSTSFVSQFITTSVSKITEVWEFVRLIRSFAIEILSQFFNKLSAGFAGRYNSIKFTQQFVGNACLSGAGISPYGLHRFDCFLKSSHNKVSVAQQGDGVKVQGFRVQVSSCKLQVAGFRFPAGGGSAFGGKACNLRLATCSLKQVSGYGLQGFKLQGFKLQVAGFRFPAGGGSAFGGKLEACNLQLAA